MIAIIVGSIGTGDVPSVGQHCCAPGVRALLPGTTSGQLVLGRREPTHHREQLIQGGRVEPPALPLSPLPTSQSSAGPLPARRGPPATSATGPGAVLAAGGVPPYPETQAYVRTIEALANQFTGPSGGGGPVPVSRPLHRAGHPHRCGLARSGRRDSSRGPGRAVMPPADPPARGGLLLHPTAMRQAVVEGHPFGVIPEPLGDRKGMARGYTIDPIRLRLTRVRADLTQAELADLVGTIGSQISRYERGSAQPSVKTIQKLAAALEIAPAVLFAKLEDDERKLSDLRVSAGMTQADVANALELNDGNYSAIERGELGLTPELAQRLADTFGVAYDQLLAAYFNVRRYRRARGMQLLPLREDHVRSPEEPAVPRIPSKGPRPFTPPPGYE